MIASLYGEERAVRRLGLVAVVALAGCASTKTTIDDVFPAYEGKPVSFLLAKWGAPQVILRGNLGPVYVWNSSADYTSTTPVTSTGTIGNTPFMITTPITETVTARCRMEAHADQSGRLIGIKWDGARGACTAWADRLR